MPKQVNEVHVPKIAEELKCKKYDYIGKTNVSLKKHTNTKHPHENVEPSNGEVNLHEAGCVLDCIDDLL